MQHILEVYILCTCCESAKVNRPYNALTQNININGTHEGLPTLFLLVIMINMTMMA